MNHIEKQLILLIKRMKTRGHIVSVKAEFEAEGTRSDELLRLKDVISKCSIPLTLKIGGCEALKDLYEARQFGSSFIVAPMIESSYALSKFCQTIKRVYPQDEINEVDFLFNVETKQAYNNIDPILEVAKSNKCINGIVFGRTDFANSMHINNDVQNAIISDKLLQLAKKISKTDLNFIVGGAVSIDTVDLLKEIAKERLTRFETRKIVLDGSKIESKDLKETLLDAVHFEILWLLNKENYYKSIQLEDEDRINTLEKRWGVLKRDLVI